MREREFNSSTSEVNVEYLVNILRKFLMTHDLSERAKLVTVLCSILHLRGDDAKVFIPFLIPLLTFLAHITVSFATQCTMQSIAPLSTVY